MKKTTMGQSPWLFDLEKKYVTYENKQIYKPDTAP